MKILQIKKCHKDHYLAGPVRVDLYLVLIRLQEQDFKQEILEDCLVQNPKQAAYLETNLNNLQMPQLQEQAYSEMSKIPLNQSSKQLLLSEIHQHVVFLRLLQEQPHLLV